MRTFRLLFVTAFVMLLMTSASYSVVLTTTFAGGNGNAGNFFDVNTLGGDLNVSRLDLNLDPGTFTVELYTRSGTWVGNNASPVGWTLVGSSSVISAGTNNPSPFNVAFTLPGASTTGMYVTVVGSAAINYTNGTAVGNVFASNADLQIREGAGSGVTLFPASLNTPRVWNGSFVYELASSAPEVNTHAMLAPLCMLLFGFAVLGSRSPKAA